MADDRLTPTVHACAVVLGRFGVLIEGASGSGKSRLADALIEAAHQKNQFARWVADDRVVISGEGSRCTASAPPVIAGQAEHAFLGIVDTPHLESAKIDLVVRLLPSDPLERMPFTTESRYGLPLLFVPQRALSVSVPLVQARLRQIG
ncbi:HPr kinase/phosphatase C-terminal domain-containing protein [Pseudahrensia aquimaris]|uniref:HPr kinase/phosphatase C-terminal domain-containing protein n=1 Tax=Pseudahrensia aquimaris TaxID=744461 RepID=A0ABW3FGS3_9HYPH